jgi:hypothetical protein
MIATFRHPLLSCQTNGKARKDEGHSSPSSSRTEKEQAMGHQNNTTLFIPAIDRKKEHISSKAVAFCHFSEKSTLTGEKGAFYRNSIAILIGGL